MALLTRRDLIRFLGAASISFAAGPGCKSSVSSGATTDTIFTDSEKDTLGALADAVLPPDQDPGGKALGAVPYIENLIATIQSGANGVFANGPFSGRTPFADATGNATGNMPGNDFASWVELDRVAALAWKIKILGSNAIAGGAPNDDILGPVLGLKDQLHQGIAAAIALSPNGVPLSTLGADDLAAVFQQLDPDFRDLLVDLVTQAAFAAPEYGGNPNLAGWKLVNFEGDSQPLGYSQWNGSGYTERPNSPMSTANPGPDPAPIDADTDQLLTLVAGVLNGRVAS